MTWLDWTGTLISLGGVVAALLVTMVKGWRWLGPGDWVLILGGVAFLILWTQARGVVDGLIYTGGFFGVLGVRALQSLPAHQESAPSTPQ